MARLGTIPGIGITRSRLFSQILRYWSWNRNHKWKNRPNYRVRAIPFQESHGIGFLRFQLQESRRNRNRSLTNHLKPSDGSKKRNIFGWGKWFWMNNVLIWIQGPYLNDVSKMFRFFNPPWPQLALIYSIKFMQSTLLLPLKGDPPSNVYIT